MLDLEPPQPVCGITSTAEPSFTGCFDGCRDLGEKMNGENHLAKLSWSSSCFVLLCIWGLINYRTQSASTRLQLFPFSHSVCYVCDHNGL